MKLGPLGAAVICLLGCRHVTNPKAVHVGTPTASESAMAIIERYQMDPELADELFKGKVVFIRKFRVDKAGRKFLKMKQDGYVVRLRRPSDTEKIRKGDTVKLYCEGKGLRKEKLIAFDHCHARLEQD